MLKYDITGRYEFHRDASSPGLQIVRVDMDTGAILEGQVGQNAIRGQYDDDTLKISFDDTRLPGHTLFVTFYTGTVMVNGQGAVYAMTGAYQELTISRGEEIAARVAGNSAGHGAAEAGAAVATATEGRPNFGVSTLQGFWFAIRLDEPLV